MINQRWPPFSPILFALDSMYQSKITWFGKELTLSQTTNFRFPNRRSLQMTILNLMKMVESFLKGKKILWEKEKLLVTSNFSFSHSLFKSLVDLLQTRKKPGLVWKGLRKKNLLRLFSKCLSHRFIYRYLVCNLDK